MKLWLLTGDQSGYDTYDSVVVAAKTKEEAQKIAPDPHYEWGTTDLSQVWASCLEKVKVYYLGIAVTGTEPGVILSSFNAG